MRKTPLLLLTAAMGIVPACSDRLPTSPESGTSAASFEAAAGRVVTPVSRTRHPVVISPRRPLEMWGSERASLRVRDGGATLEILSATLPTGGCFGAYGEISQPIPNGNFALPGTYTQLMGVFPGRVEYAAQFSGFVEGNQMSITVSVPSPPQTLGPFDLTRGVNSAWVPCLFP